MDGLKDDVRYKPKRFEQQLQKLSPIAYKQYLKDSKGTGRVFEYRNDGTIWRVTKYVKGIIVKYSIYNKAGDLVKKFKMSNNDLLRIARGIIVSELKQTGENNNGKTV